MKSVRFLHTQIFAPARAGDTLIDLNIRGAGRAAASYGAASRDIIFASSRSSSTGLLS